ncbi:putative methyltransferase PMT22 [Sesamum angolense]|uniref:Methyltransferase n=1 Tax=Sesamum angolense TaxID=2727404 RepID=A0AAE1W209_9LAMI|nr:putative methyltransferase PMT22 [Sesamum angolense]
MDMNAGYGSFAAALINQPLWVMNVVPIHRPDTLSAIFDRGLIGTYHDWCESFNTYPRTYDLLHSSFLLRNLSMRCDIIAVAAEMDRILRPGGYLLVQDTIETITKITPILKSLEWSIKFQLPCLEYHLPVVAIIIWKKQGYNEQTTNSSAMRIGGNGKENNRNSTLP